VLLNYKATHPIRHTKLSFTSNLLLLFNTKRGAIPLLSLRIAPSYSLLHTNNTPIAVNKLSPVSPWTLITPIVVLDLATNTKSNTAPEVYKTLYCELKQHCLHYQEFFYRRLQKYQSSLCSYCLCKVVWSPTLHCRPM